MDYRGVFAGADGLTYTVRFYDGAAGAITEIQVSNLTIEEDSEEDIFKPVRTWSGVVTLFNDGGVDFSTLIPVSAHAISFSVTDQTGKVHWKGYVRPETYSQSYTGVGEAVEIQVTSPIGASGGSELDLQNHDIDMIGSIVRECLVTCGYDDTDAFVMPHVYDDAELGGGTGVEILGYGISRFLFFHESGMNEDDPYYQTYVTDDPGSVLGKIFQFFGMTVRERGDGVYITHPNAVEYARGTIGGLSQLSYDAPAGWSVSAYSSRDADGDMSYVGMDQYEDIDAGRKYVQLQSNLHLLDGNIFADLSADDFRPYSSYEENLGQYVDNTNTRREMCRHLRLRHPSNEDGFFEGKLYRFTGSASSFDDAAYDAASNWSPANINDFTLRSANLYNPGTVHAKYNTMTGATIGSVVQPRLWDDEELGRLSLDENDFKEGVIIYPSERTNGYGRLSPDLPVFKMRSKNAIPYCYGALVLSGDVGVTYRHCDNYFDYSDHDHMWADTYLGPYSRCIDTYRQCYGGAEDYHFYLWAEIKVGDKYYANGVTGINHTVMRLPDKYCVRADAENNTYLRGPLLGYEGYWTTTPTKTLIFVASRPSKEGFSRSLIGDNRPRNSPYTGKRGFVMETLGAVSGDVEITFYVDNKFAEMIYLTDLKLEFCQREEDWMSWHGGSGIDRGERHYYRKSQRGFTGAPYIVNLDLCSYGDDSTGSYANVSRGSAGLREMSSSLPGLSGDFTPESVLLNLISAYYDNAVQIRTLTFRDTSLKFVPGTILTQDGARWVVLSSSVDYSAGTVTYKVTRYRALTEVV